MYTNASITIYRIDENEIYHRFHVNNVFLEQKEAYSTNKTGLTSTNAFSVRIPFISTDFVIKKDDIVVNGVIDDDINSIRDLKTKYDVVFIVNNVDTFDYGSLHMRNRLASGN